ncbi:MAG: RNA polymerase sigma factor ShbA, partial [Janthinobacterium lividum]
MSPGGDEAGGQADADAAERLVLGAAPDPLGSLRPVEPREPLAADEDEGARAGDDAVTAGAQDGAGYQDTRDDSPEPGDDISGTVGAPGVTGVRRTPMKKVDAGGLQELATRALSGDQGAVAELLAAVRRLVHRYCRAKLGRLPGADHAAEDAAQEVCIAVLTALPRYKDTGRPFEAFVYRIAANKVADAQRATYRAPMPTDDIPDTATSEAGPEQLALEAFDAETVGRLLDTLPAKLREILTLRVGAGMSAEETGRALDMTAGAVRVAQHRAMQ